MLISKKNTVHVVEMDEEMILVMAYALIAGGRQDLALNLFTSTMYQREQALEVIRKTVEAMRQAAAQAAQQVGATEQANGTPSSEPEPG